MLKRLNLFVYVFVFAFFPSSVIHAQTAAFRINRVIYNLQRTKISAFERYFGQLASTEFSSREELDEFLEDLRQRMYRSSMFRTFDVTPSFPEGGGPVQNVDLSVTVKESWPAMGVVFPLYTTSWGFIVGGGGIFPNVSGYLFDIVMNFSYNAEPRGDGLAWSDPIYKGGIAFSKIPLGHNLFFGISSDVIRNSNTVRDRGREVLTYRALSSENELSLLWRANHEWSLLNTLKYTAGFMPQIEYDAHTGEDFGVPKEHYYIQKLVVDYDGTVQGKDLMPAGLSSEMMIGYSFNKGFSGLVDNAFLFSAHVNYTWNIYDIFYPGLSAYTFYKTGQPEYNLAREMRGIIDGEWRGNGITRLSADFLFYIGQVTGWFVVHMGPYVDYGISYGRGQKFLKDDQGWALGLRMKVLSPLAPSTPVFLDLGFDLRDKYPWHSLSRHFELTIGSTFSI